MLENQISIPGNSTKKIARKIKAMIMAHGIPIIRLILILLLSYIRVKRHFGSVDRWQIRLRKIVKAWTHFLSLRFEVIMGFRYNLLYSGR